MDTLENLEPLVKCNGDPEDFAGVLPPSVKGTWYISRYVPAKRNSEYLHKDGIWRRSTQHQSYYTGYWDTREEAEAFLAQWREENP